MLAQTGQGQRILTDRDRLAAQNASGRASTCADSSDDEDRLDVGEPADLRPASLTSTNAESATSSSPVMATPPSYLPGANGQLPSLSASLSSLNGLGNLPGLTGNPYAALLQTLPPQQLSLVMAYQEMTARLMMAKRLPLPPQTWPNVGLIPTAGQDPFATAAAAAAALMFSPFMQQHQQPQQGVPSAGPVPPPSGLDDQTPPKGASDKGGVQDTGITSSPPSSSQISNMEALVESLQQQRRKNSTSNNKRRRSSSPESGSDRISSAMGKYDQTTSPHRSDVEDADDGGRDSPRLKTLKLGECPQKLQKLFDDLRRTTSPSTMECALNSGQDNRAEEKGGQVEDKEEGITVNLSDSEDADDEVGSTAGED